MCLFQNLVFYAFKRLTVSINLCVCQLTIREGEWGGGRDWEREERARVILFVIVCLREIERVCEWYTEKQVKETVTERERDSRELTFWRERERDWNGDSKRLK